MRLYTRKSHSKNKKGTWAQAIFALFLPIIILLTVRWLLFEPYVIPSSSMVPSLLIHDYILVDKFAYGIRLPFMEKWLWQFQLPRRGEVVVFRNPKEADSYFIKRVVGLPGDKIYYEKGQLFINDTLISREQIADLKSFEGKYIADYFEDHQLWLEKLDDFGHMIMSNPLYPNNDQYGPSTVPAGHLFLMGDNRDGSSDSRVWGFLPIEKLLGRATYIWLSCDQLLSSSSILCDPSTLRHERIFRKIR